MTNDQNSLLLIKDIVIAIAAFSGMGMSFYNLWNEHQKEKVKLVVSPRSIKGKGFSDDNREFIITSKDDFNGELSNNLFAIEVINLSKFDVTVDDVGFYYYSEKRRVTIPNPIVPDNLGWPRKLESRQSVTIYCNLNELLQTTNVPKIRCAYAETSCEEIIEGSSQALIELVKFSKRFI